jgi:hypothetical protein
MQIIRSARVVRTIEVAGALAVKALNQNVILRRAAVLKNKIWINKYKLRNN